MSFWRTFLQTIAKNPISTFAVVLVAGIVGFLGYMVVWQTNILTSPGWCRQAMGAEKQLPDQTAQQALEALKSCNNLLMVQIEAVAADSHIDHSIFGLVLVVLIVVVVAGARLAFKVSKQGVEGDISRHGDPAVDAAKKVAGAAAEEAKEIGEDAEPPEYNGPAMPEPKK